MSEERDMIINQHLIRPIFKKVPVRIYHAEIQLRMSKENFFKTISSASKENRSFHFIIHYMS